MTSKEELTAAIDPDATIGIATDALREKGELKSRFIHCAYGPGNLTDYILHIEPMHPKRPFPHDLTDVCRIVHKHLSKKFPRAVQIEIALPDPEWVVQHLVFEALDAMTYWNFEESEIEKALPGLLEELDQYVDHYAQSRRSRR